MTDYDFGIDAATFLMVMTKHVGKEHAIIARKLCKAVGAPDMTNNNMTTYIRQFVEAHNVPILACRNGYYIASSQEELDAYVDRTTRTAMEMLAGVGRAVSAFKAWHR